MKFEVLENCTLAVKKGSIVIVDEQQVRYASKFLKAIEEREAKKEKTEKVEQVEKPKPTKKKKGE